MWPIPPSNKWRYHDEGSWRAAINRETGGREREQEKLAERRTLVRGYYHLSPSGVASLYKFLYVLGFNITKRTRGTDTTARTLDRGGDRDARKSLKGGGVRSFVVSFVRRSVGPSVRPSIRWFVRWYWPCNWAQTLSSARPAKDYTPACPEGPEPNVPVWYIMLQIPVSDSRGEAGVNGVTFSVVLKAHCRQRVPWSKRCNGPIIDKQITRRRSTWIKQSPPPLQIKWSLRWPISFARDLSVTPWLVDLLARYRIRVMRFWDWFARTGLLILTSQMVNTSSWLRSFIIWNVVIFYL